MPPGVSAGLLPASRGGTPGDGAVLAAASGHSKLLLSVQRIRLRPVPWQHWRHLRPWVYGRQPGRDSGLATGCDCHTSRRPSPGRRLQLSHAWFPSLVQILVTRPICRFYGRQCVDQPFGLQVHGPFRMLDAQKHAFSGLALCSMTQG